MSGKQAILITAYRDEPQLMRLIRQFGDADHFRVFVHIDKKSKEISEAHLEAMGLANLELVRKYRICWGSINHLFAVLDLIRMALAHQDVGYLHIASGCDMAIRTPGWFVEKFADSDVSYSDLNYGGGNLGGHYDWCARWWLPSTCEFRYRNRLNRLLVKVQRFLHIKRMQLGELSIDELSDGLIWGSYPRVVCEQFLSFEKAHPKFLRALNTVHVPEEKFISTQVYNGKVRRHPSGYCRFSVWGVPGRGGPAILDERDYDAMFKGDYFFARKIDSEKSAKLIEMIEARLRADS